MRKGTSLHLTIVRSFHYDNIQGGSTNATVFEDFIGQLLRHRGRWPEPKSTLVMNNASFHHSERTSGLRKSMRSSSLFMQ
jgi:hypothetical protein